VDRLTKHAQFIPTSIEAGEEASGAEATAILFIRYVVSHFGIPQDIIADRDGRWVSDFWKGVSKYLSTKLSLSSSHHPQHDSETEIVNKTLGAMLRAYIAEDKKSWVKWLPLIEFAYNTSTQASMGALPSLLLYGFEPRSMLDFISKKFSIIGESLSLPQESKEFLESFHLHRESAKRSIALAQDSQARNYNRRRRSIPDITIGSKVLVNPHALEWVESKGKSGKLVQRWLGPFEVIQRINPKVFRLRMSDQYLGSPMFNIDHLRPCTSDLGPQTLLPDTRSKLPSIEYPVEPIIGHRRKNGTLQYRLRWEGFSPQFDSWATTRDLKNAPDFLREYKLRNNL
jgi:hypothetical protein